MSFDVAYEHVIYPDYGLELEEDTNLGFDEFGEKVLGLFDPRANRAYIDICLHPREGDPRRAFTCWHELAGHGILHGPWVRREIERLGSTMAIQVTELSIRPDTTNVLERQANLFAAHAAAPTWLVVHAIRKRFGYLPHNRLTYTGPGQYSFTLDRGTRLHVVKSFQEFCTRTAYYIKPFFGGLSVEALSYRVAECPLVHAPQHLRHLMRRSAPKTKLSASVGQIVERAMMGSFRHRVGSAAVK
jgi:hypothetical protein